MEIPSFNRVTIDLKALQQNFRLLQKKSKEAAFLAMIKADAYGHGMLECAKALESAGCQIFGVAELREAILLRSSGIRGAIFAMIGFDSAAAPAFVDYDITPVVYDQLSMEALSAAAVQAKKEIQVHLKVDTGMSRLGISLSEIDTMLDAITQLPGLELGGIASHFPCADDTQSDVTETNFSLFEQFMEKTSAYPKIVYHIANSGGTLYFSHTSCDMVRCGISLYGYYPDGRTPDNPGELLPVMSFKTKVLQVKELPKGAGVSYGHTFVTKRQTKIAVLPVGYEDGYSRKLSNCGEVLIRGKRAPIRGRVCMNLCMVDVTEFEDVEAGDEVVLLGSQGNDSITADDLARLCGTISYEILCMIGNNNQRAFI